MWNDGGKDCRVLGLGDDSVGVVVRWALGEFPEAGSRERPDHGGGFRGESGRRGFAGGSRWGVTSGVSCRSQGIDGTLMSDFTINGVHEAGFSRVESVRASGRADRGVAASAPSVSAGRVGDEDRVELSDRALFLAKLKELPDVREDVIARARERIASGFYDSSEALDGTVEALARDIDLRA